MKALPSDHPQIGLLLENLARLHYCRHEYAESEVLYQRAVIVLGKPMDSEHPMVASMRRGPLIVYVGDLAPH